MHISRISTVNFYGEKTLVVKNTMKKADKEARKLTKDNIKNPTDSFINYNQSSYSVPTGDFPRKQAQDIEHSFSPECSIIPNEYLKAKETPNPVQEEINYISESSVM